MTEFPNKKFACIARRVQRRGIAFMRRESFNGVWYFKTAIWELTEHFCDNQIKVNAIPKYSLVSLCKIFCIPFVLRIHVRTRNSALRTIGGWIRTRSTYRVFQPANSPLYVINFSNCAETRSGYACSTFCIIF